MTQKNKRTHAITEKYHENVVHVNIIQEQLHVYTHSYFSQKSTRVQNVVCFNEKIQTNIKLLLLNLLLAEHRHVIIHTSRKSVLHYLATWLQITEQSNTTS